MDTFVTSAEEIPIPMNVSPDGLTSHEGSLGDRWSGSSALVVIFEHKNKKYKSDKIFPTKPHIISYKDQNWCLLVVQNGYTHMLMGLFSLINLRWNLVGPKYHGWPLNPSSFLVYVLASFNAISSGDFSFWVFFFFVLISPVFKSTSEVPSNFSTPFWSCFATASLAAALRTLPPTLARVVTELPSPFSSSMSFKTLNILALGWSDCGWGVPVCPAKKPSEAGRLRGDTWSWCGSKKYIIG